MMMIREEAGASGLPQRRLQRRRRYWLEIIAINLTLWIVIGYGLKILFWPQF